MEKSTIIEKTLYDLYMQIYKSQMDEMKMHKLMYFSQRESFIVNKEQLFEEDFHGWKYGPVLFSVREEYSKPKPYEMIHSSTSQNTLCLLNAVLKEYGGLSSWRLSALSHEELSWRISRDGLDPSENGNRIIPIQAIKLDAIMESMKRCRK